ncbi:MAG: FAD-dependent oxidoreductase [Pseudomonadota bacterium]
MTERVVVLGAGQAAQSLIESARAAGFEGPITLVGDEPVPPYQRPPLSKGYLLGETTVERLGLRPRSFYDTAGVELRLAARAVAIDRAARQVALADGARLPYDKLALTLGSQARRLPERMGGAAAGVYAVRTLADVDDMAPEFAAGRRALIVGGGYIGLEAAAVARKLGLEVTLIEREPRILARVACEETASYFRALHEGEGVELLEGAALERLEIGAEGRVSGGVLTDGRRLAADFAIIGVGAAPNDAIAAEAGLAVGDPAMGGGIQVGADCRTSDPDILAAGDVARIEHQGASIRLESVQNAIDQGAVAGRVIAGEAALYAPKPWFWSDQYDVKLQIAGLFRVGERAADLIVSRPGAREGAREGARSIWSFQSGAGGAPARLMAVDAMNDAKAYMTGKRWIEAGLSPDPAALGDPAAELKSLETQPTPAPSSGA